MDVDEALLLGEQRLALGGGGRAENERDERAFHCLGACASPVRKTPLVSKPA